MPTKNTLQSYLFEFISIFLAVVLAFALNNWNDNRRDNNAADKILKEIRNGLHQDLEDMDVNIGGHKTSIRSCQVFRDIVHDRSFSADSLGLNYIALMRDYLPVMNISGYESLKARGLELIKNDSLRQEIISLYDFQYEIITKIEEEAQELQSFRNYYGGVSSILGPHLQFDEKGNPVGIQQPINLSKAEKNQLLDYLWRMQINRGFKLIRYEQTKEKVNELIASIEDELSD